MKNRRLVQVTDSGVSLTKITAHAAVAEGVIHVQAQPTKPVARRAHGMMVLPDLLWAARPETNSVTVTGVHSGRNRKPKLR